MKKKKSFGDNIEFLEILFTYGWAILGILIAVGTLIYFGTFNIPYLTNENQWCKINVDKCVCEGFAVNEEDIKADKPINELGYHCSEFRKKTQAELDIDDCNKTICREKTKEDY